jgi:hypothetical protein
MVSWLALLLLGQSATLGITAETVVPFADFPATRAFHGTPASPILRTAGQRRFRTRIREAAREGPNFAGHYTIAEWGCGTSCVSISVVDAETGTVYEGPFGPLPTAILYYGSALLYDRDASGAYLYDELSYRLNSRLLIARGCPNDANCGAYFYEWTGSTFKLLRKISATPEVR